MLTRCSCTAPRCSDHGEHAPCSMCPPPRACKHCGELAERLGPIGMWQHCPKHEDGALTHEFMTPSIPERVEAAIDSIGPVPGVLALALGSLILTALGGAL